MRRSRALLATALLAAALAACTPHPAPTPTPTPAVVPGELGAPGCEPASPHLGDVYQATGVGATTASGLLQTQGVPEPRVDEALKLVMRMTGSGDLTAGLVAPDGSDRPLDWGPEPHGSSNFSGEGDEWGIGFTFDAPGCWAVELHREGGEQATFWFDAA